MPLRPACEAPCGGRNSTPVHLLDRAFITINCPACTYALDVQLRSVRLEDRVFCPCCKIAIRLVDAEASTHVAHADIDDAMTELQQTIDAFDPSLTFKL